MLHSHQQITLEGRTPLAYVVNAVLNNFSKKINIQVLDEVYSVVVLYLFCFLPF